MHSNANSVAQKGKWMTHQAGGERAKRMTYHSEQISNCDLIPTKDILCIQVYYANEQAMLEQKEAR